MTNIDFKDDWLNTLKDLALLIDKLECDETKSNLNNKLVNLIQAFPKQSPEQTVQQYKKLQTDILNILTNN